MAILKRRGRDRLFIMAEILDVAKEGALKTEIMYKANLSFAQLNEYLSLHMHLGLLRVTEEHGKSIYKTTEQGFRYLSSYREISDLVTKQSSPRVRHTNHLDKMKSELRELKKTIDNLEITLMDSVECPQCQEYIFPEYQFCPFCGKKLHLEVTIGARNETTRN